MEILDIATLDIAAVVARLRDGATVVYPTETCYGLGCDATNLQAVQKLYDIKGRKEDKPFIVIVDTFERMIPYIEVTAKLEEIAKKYWPAALTVVVQAKPNGGLAPGVIGSDGTIYVGSY